VIPSLAHIFDDSQDADEQPNQHSGNVFVHKPVFFGALDPTWPHAILIGGSIVGGVIVAAGIILKQKKLFSLPTMLVVVGVVIEAACTIALFGFDEGISRLQNAEILRLRHQSANRDITPDEMNKASSNLTKFAGQPAEIVVFPVNFESVWVAENIHEILLDAHWNVPLPTRLSAPPGNGFMVQGIFIDRSNDDASKEAANALRETLNSTISPTSSAGASGSSLFGKPLSGAFDPAKPLVWVLVGDKPVPLGSWVVP
jgi:hypothetical protein